MDRRTIVFGSFLVAAGVAAGVLFRTDLLRAAGAVVPATAAQWDEQVRLDAVSLLDLVRPDERLPETLDGQSEFWAKWDARRAAYPAGRLDDLRNRLHDYLDFLQAEYADCAEIYRDGRRPEGRSDAASEARRRVAAAFGDFAARTLLPQADALREEAFRASPKIGGEPDPDLPDFVESYADLRDRFLPLAHRRVDELTRPVAK